MAFSIIGIFFISLFISFVGSLPFGPINLVMIDTTLKNSLRAGFWFSLAAALVELGQSVVAVQGSFWINQAIHEGPWIKIGGFIFFSILGCIFLFKKDDTNVLPSKNTHRFFVKGLIVAFLNPQAIPFWVIVLALLQSVQIQTVTSQSPILNILSFAIGASFGKLGALLLFGVLSERIVSRSSLIRQHINRIIAIILLTVGLFQGVLVFV